MTDDDHQEDHGDLHALVAATAVLLCLCLGCTRSDNTWRLPVEYTAVECDQADCAVTLSILAAEAPYRDTQQECYREVEISVRDVSMTDGLDLANTVVTVDISNTVDNPDEPTVQELEFTVFEAVSQTYRWYMDAEVCHGYGESQTIACFGLVEDEPGSFTAHYWEDWGPCSDCGPDGEECGEPDE